MGTRRPDLQNSALASLKAIGFQFRGVLPKEEGFGSSVFLFENGNSEVRVLVQTRGASKDDRYWIGLMYPDLLKVDFVVVWIEGRDKVLVLPAARMKQIWDDCGSPKIVNGNQWSVDVEWKLESLSPTGMGGYLYELTGCFMSLPSAA